MSALQIFDGCEWQDYLKNDDNHLNFVGFYYGSSTRIGSLGTVMQRQQLIERYIRIVTNNERICQFHISTTNIAYALRDTLHCPSLQLYDSITNMNATVTLRDLHKFPDHPYEISSFQLTI